MAAPRRFGASSGKRRSVEGDFLNSDLRTSAYVPQLGGMSGTYTPWRLAPLPVGSGNVQDLGDNDRYSSEDTDELEDGEIDEDYDKGEIDDDHDERESDEEEYFGDPVRAGAQDLDNHGNDDSYGSMAEESVPRGRGRGRGRGQSFRGAKDSGSSGGRGDRATGEWRGGSNRGSRGSGANVPSQRGRSDNQRARGSGRGDHPSLSSASHGPSQFSNSPAYPPKSSTPKRKDSMFINDDSSSEGRGAEEDESEEAQSTDDGNDASGHNVNSKAALAAFEKHMNEKWIRLKEDREIERQKAIANGIIADPEKKTTLENAIKPVGECEDMCPEYERAERIVQKTVDRWEKPFSRSGKDKLPDERMMVKKFRRSAAGVDEQLPTDLRTPAALKRSTDYLIDQILGGRQPFASVHKFVWDRTRAIRNDITILQFTNPADVRIAIYCLERIARFHILALHKLSPEYEDEEFNAYQEREQLNSTLVALRNLYDDNRNREVSPNEAEFRAYSIILDSSPNIEDQVQGWPRHLLKDSQVHLALQFHALRQNAADRKGPLIPGARPNIAQEDFGGYFQLLKTPAVSYLMACVAEMFFNEVREMGLRNLMDGYKRRAAHDRVFTRNDLMLAFAFDSEDEAQEFAEAHGIYFGVPSGPDWVNFAGSSFAPDSNSARRQAFSDTYVEYKNYNRTLPEVIHAVKVADSANIGMYDHGSDQAMGNAAGPSSAPNPPPFRPSNTPFSQSSFSFNPSATTFVPPSASSPFPASPTFRFPSAGNPANAKTATPTTSPLFKAPASAALGGSFPSFGVPGSTATSNLPGPSGDSGSAAPLSPFPSFGAPEIAAPSNSTPSFGVSGAGASSNPFPSFGVPSSTAPSVTFPASGFAAASSTDPKTKRVSFADGHGVTAPSQPPSNPFPSLAPATSVLVGGRSLGASNSLPTFSWLNPTPTSSSNPNTFPAASSQSPGASSPAPTFSWSNPKPTPSSDSSTFPAPSPTFTATPPSQPPSGPSFRPGIHPPSNLGGGADATPPSQFPSTSLGSFTSQPPAPPSHSSGPPSQPLGSQFQLSESPSLPPFQPSGPPSLLLFQPPESPSLPPEPPSQPPGSPFKPSGSPYQPPGAPFQPSGPPSQPPGPPSRPSLPLSQSPADIKRQQEAVLHQTVSTYFVQNNGIFEQLVEVQATPIIEEVMRELKQERVNKKWQKIRSRYLALKYGRLWRTKAYVMFRHRTSRDRRERMRKLREAGIKQQREALEKQKVREARQAAKAAKAAETNGIKEVRVREGSHTPPHHMAQFQTSPSGGISSEPNRKRNHITFSEQVRMLHAVKDAFQPEKAEERRRHKRTKTVDNPHPQREGFHDDGIEYERMPNGSWTRKIHNPWAHKHKLNWTKTDYFKCKAMGIDPNTPMIPPSFRTLEKMNEKQRLADDGADSGSPTNKFQKVSSNGRRASAPQIVNDDDEDYSKYTPQRKASPERGTWSPDDDPILMESRRLRALMEEDEAAMRAERLAYEKELNEASIRRLRPAPRPSNGHGSTSNGHGSPSYRQPHLFVPTISRTEQRIARTGAHGLAYKTVKWNKPSPGPPRRPSHLQHPVSQPSFGDDSDYENNGDGNGTGPGGERYGMSGATSQGPSGGPSAAATPGGDGTSADNAFCLDSD